MRWIYQAYRKLSLELRDTFRWEAQVVSFSDSLLVYSEPLPREFRAWTWEEWHDTHVSNFLRYLGMLIRDAFGLGLPLRGGVAYGDCVINTTRGIFVGQPIIDAYRLEGAQQWAGVCVDDSVIQAFEGRHLPNQLVQYQIPFKEGQEVLSTWTIDWPNASNEDGRDEVFELAQRYAEAHEGTQYAQVWRDTSLFVNSRADGRVWWPSR